MVLLLFRCGVNGVVAVFESNSDCSGLIVMIIVTEGGDGRVSAMGLPSSAGMDDREVTTMVVMITMVMLKFVMMILTKVTTSLAYPDLIPRGCHVPCWVGREDFSCVVTCFSCLALSNPSTSFNSAREGSTSGRSSSRRAEQNNSNNNTNT